MKRVLLLALVGLVAVVSGTQAHPRHQVVTLGEESYEVAVSFRRNIAAVGEAPAYENAAALAINCGSSDRATAVLCAYSVVQNGATIIDDRSVVIISPEVIESATAYTAVRGAHDDGAVPVK